MSNPASPLPPPEDLNVRLLMTAAPVSAKPETTLREVVTLMRERGIGAVVVTEQDAPVGIFTERDLLQRATSDTRNWDRRPVRELMTANPWTVAPDEAWLTALEQMQQRKIRHAPVVEGGRLIGVLSVRDLVQHHEALLESLVRQRTSELLEQKAIIEDRDRERTHSLKIAGRIQRQLLPVRAPEFSPVQIAFAFQPHDLVAGDYFDLQLASPDTLTLLIGDASGHGVPAAFISVIAKTCVQTNLTANASPASLLGAMNEFLYGWVEPEHFISMFIAAIDRRTLKMTYARAGHPRPLLLRNDGTLAELDAGGIMLGVLPDARFPEQLAQLRPGDRVLFYTDGLTECPNSNGELFGVERVQRFLSDNRSQDCERVVSGLLTAVLEFSADDRFTDDLTVILLEIHDDRSD